MIPDEDVENRFTYHPPKDTVQRDKYQLLREKCKMLAKEILRQTPPSREQSVAITKLEEVMFWANAAVARNE